MKKNPLLAIFLIVLVDILGLTIILPLLPFYAEKYGGSPAVYGVLVTTYAFCQLISGPMLGRISDTTGRKPLLLVSQIGTFIGFIILAFANSLGLIFLSRIIDGMTAGNLSLAQAYISDVTEPENRAKAFGIIGISFGIGFLIGPALSGYLSQFGYQYPALAAAGLSFLSIMGTAFLLPPAPKHAATETTPRAPGTIRENIFQWRIYIPFFKEREIRRLLFEFFLFAFSFSMFISGMALFLERRFSLHGHPFGVREVGYLFAYSGFLGILIQGGVLGRIVKRFGERKVLFTGFLCMGAGYGLLSLIHTIPLLLVVMIFSSFGSGVVRPAITSLITQTAGRHQQGVVLGLNQSLNSIAQIIAPLIAGELIALGWLNSWACATGFVALIGFVVSRLNVEKRQTYSQSPSPLA